MARNNIQNLDEKCVAQGAIATSDHERQTFCSQILDVRFSQASHFVQGQYTVPVQNGSALQILFGMGSSYP